MIHVYVDLEGVININMTIKRIELPEYFKDNYLYLGDNLELMKQLPSESIDLIYGDPPYFSQRNYSTTSKTDNVKRTFTDTFKTLTEYLQFLQIRLVEMKRLLKPTGSIYIHVDWHASHYIKVMMDSIFGYDNFINDIIWTYTGGGSCKKAFARKHDNILLYSKTENYTFNANEVTIPPKPGTEFIKDKEGKTYYTKGGTRYYVERDGKLLEDYWNDIPNLNHNKLSERHQYPTEKPEKLLERCIKASSNMNDVVADFFGGSGVTSCVSQRLNRKWITCDMSEDSTNLIKSRLLGNVSIKENKYQLPIDAYK